MSFVGSGPEIPQYVALSPEEEKANVRHGGSPYLVLWLRRWAGSGTVAVTG